MKRRILTFLILALAAVLVTDKNCAMAADYNTNKEYCVIEDLDYLMTKDRMNDNLPIKVTIYATPSNSIAICRAYHFVPYSYEPITEYKVIKK